MKPHTLNSQLMASTANTTPRHAHLSNSMSTSNNNRHGYHSTSPFRASKDRNRIPIRDMNYIIKAMRNLRQPTTILDSPLKAKDGGRSSSTMLRASSVATTTDTIPAHAATATPSAAMMKGTLTSTVAAAVASSPVDDGMQQLGTLADNSAAHKPDWRSLLYNDVYKDEDDQKEAIRKKYEPLLQAQAKMERQLREQSQGQAAAASGTASLFAGSARNKRQQSPRAAGTAFGSSLRSTRAVSGAKANNSPTATATGSGIAPPSVLPSRATAKAPTVPTAPKGQPSSSSGAAGRRPSNS